MKQQEGFLPGRTDANPKYQCSAILGKSVQRAGDSWEHELDMLISEEFLAEEEEIIEQFLSQTSLVSSDTDDWCRSTPTDSVDRYQPRPHIIETPEVTEERVYRPPIPYPRRPKQETQPQGVTECSEIPITLATAVVPSEPHTTPTFRKLSKLEDPGRFVVPCLIGSAEFKDAVVDSGSDINVMSSAIATGLGLKSTQTLLADISLADGTVRTSNAYLENVQVKVGDCILPTDFEVWDMSTERSMPLILGRSFLATAGVQVDLPNKRVCLTRVDRDVFYYPESRSERRRPPSCGTVTTAGKPSPQKKPQRAKPQRQQPSDAQVILTPLERVGDTIEYRIKRKGRSSPFSKVKAVITPEFKEKGQAELDAMLTRTLMFVQHKDHKTPELAPAPSGDTSPT